jgi:hypothetical protein
MRIIGIDPGLTGALALYDTEKKTVQIKDMPVVDKNVSPHGLYRLFRNVTLLPVELVAVEQVHSMPRQGVASTFKFGVGYGMILEVVACFELPIVHAIPSKWTRDLNLGNDKEKHRRRAIETWPAQASLFARVKDEGRADAALIALWAARAAAEEGQGL